MATNSNQNKFALLDWFNRILSEYGIVVKDFHQSYLFLKAFLLTKTNKKISTFLFTFFFSNVVISILTFAFF